MSPTSSARACACLIAFFATMPAYAQAPQGPRTRAETSGYEDTSRYEDVRAFLDALAAQTPRVRLDSFGTSGEGRSLPLMVIGDPPAASPEAARASGRPVVFVMANIHAGEVEGKEALLVLARRLTTGDLQPLLPAATWLFAPIYNADGNEKVSVENRFEQYGPIGGVGTRENAKGLDLNRDYMKLESSEAQGLVSLMTRWDPDVVVDLHTTNGSYHGYHLTYSPTLNPDADPHIIGFMRDRMLPALRSAMSTRHQFRTYYYGNFTTTDALAAERESFAEGDRGTRVWRTFDHRPRFGNNYVGLRNRLAILSEAYSYIDFETRIKATEAFVEEIMRFVAGNASDIRSLVRSADADWTRAPAPEAGVAFALTPLPAPVDILVGAIEPKVNPRSGKPMRTAVERAVRPEKMLDYGTFAVTGRRRVPSAYIVSTATPDALRTAVVEKLREHGIRVETLRADTAVTTEYFVVDDIRRPRRPFQGHLETSLTGHFEPRTTTVPAGSIVVSTSQPLGRLVFYLLEPESDDGLTTWNVLDAGIVAGATHPVLKLVGRNQLKTTALP